MTQYSEDNEDIDDPHTTPLTLEDLVELVDMMVSEGVRLDTPICIDLFLKGADDYLKENIQIDAQTVGWTVDYVSLGSIDI